MILYFLLCVFNDTLAQTSHAFTLHEGGAVVNFYLTPELKTTRAAIYPYKEESNAGIVVEIIGVVDSALLVKISEEYLFCHKGDLAINTRNYDGAPFILYESPSYNSTPTGYSEKQQTLRIYDFHNGWLLVNATDDSNGIINGWLPPEMQCPSIWSTCP